MAARGGQIVAITPELQEFAAELKSDAKAGFPVLTDVNNGYALALNLAIWINDEKRGAMMDAGWDISPYQGNKCWVCQFQQRLWLEATDASKLVLSIRTIASAWGSMTS